MKSASQNTRRRLKIRHRVMVPATYEEVVEIPANATKDEITAWARNRHPQVSTESLSVTGDNEGMTHVSEAELGGMSEAAGDVASSSDEMDGVMPSSPGSGRFVPMELDLYDEGDVNVCSRTINGAPYLEAMSLEGIREVFLAIEDEEEDVLEPKAGFSVAPDGVDHYAQEKRWDDLPPLTLENHPVVVDAANEFAEQQGMWAIPVTGFRVFVPGHSLARVLVDRGDWEQLKEDEQDLIFGMMDADEKNEIQADLNSDALLVEVPPAVSTEGTPGL